MGHQLVKKLYLRQILLTVYFSFRYLREGASSAAYNVHTSKIQNFTVGEYPAWDKNFQFLNSVLFFGGSLESP